MQWLQKWRHPLFVIPILILHSLCLSSTGFSTCWTLKLARSAGKWDSTKTHYYFSSLLILWRL